MRTAPRTANAGSLRSLPSTPMTGAPGIPLAPTGRVGGRPPTLDLDADDPAVALLATWAGTTFGEGLYRVHTQETASRVAPHPPRRTP